MLSHGTKEKRKWPVVVAILAVVGVLQTALCVGGLYHFLKWYFDPYIDPNGYDEQMVTALEHSNTITLSDIFEIEFDQAYICDYTDAYSSQEQILGKLEITSDVEIRQWYSDTASRILLVNDGVVVYDFCYPGYILIFKPDGLWISPDTPLTVQSQSTTSIGNTVFHIAVGE